MPLSDEVRRELAAIEPQRDCDRLAELSGLFHTAGSLHLLGHGEFSVHLDVAESASRGARSGCSAASASRPRSGRTSRTAFDGATRYQIHVPGRRALAERARPRGRPLGAHAPLEAPPKRVVGRACCRQRLPPRRLSRRRLGERAALPHLEIRTASRAGAELLAAVAAAGGRRRSASSDRGAYTAAYAKGAEAIADALALVGAGDAALALDEHAVVAEARARANRVANADHANLVRSSRAAHRQIRAIRRARGRGALARLSPPLRRDRRAAATLPLGLAARARREMPPAGDESGCTPPPRTARSPSPIVPDSPSETRSFCCPDGSYSARRVCARPPVDSDPVCRLGPERGATGGEGRPRSFPSGPPLWTTTDSPSWAQG